jgi:GDPmannose 4,6-dehydratase
VGYVVVSGETHTVRKVYQIAFDRVGLDWQDRVEVDPLGSSSPAEVDLPDQSARAARVEGPGRVSRNPRMIVDADGRAVKEVPLRINEP